MIKLDPDEFANDLKIDPEQLDVEAGMQGEIFFKWAERAVRARERFDRCKLKLDLTSSKLRLKARRDPDAYGIGKLTELSLEEVVHNQPDYEEAALNLIQARSRMVMLEQAVNAMEQRKRMIEVLITLHGQQYFAGPSVPRNLAAAWKEANRNREKATNERVSRQARNRESVGIQNQEERKLKKKRSKI